MGQAHPSWSMDGLALLKAMKAISGVVESTQVIQILGFVKMTVCPDRVVLVTSDSQIQYRYEMVVPTGISEALTLAVSCKKLLEICRLVDHTQPLVMVLKDGWLHINCASASFVLATLSADDYPETSGVELTSQVDLPAVDMLKILERIQFAMAQEDTRQHLVGLHLRLEEQAFVATATDGHRLAIADGPMPTLPEGVAAQLIVPRKTVHEMLKVLGEAAGDEPFALAWGPAHLQVSLGPLLLTSNLIEGEYPDCRSLFPHPNACLGVGVDRQALVERLKRAAIVIDDKFQGVRVAVDEGSLRVQAHNTSHEQTLDSLSVDYQGESILVGFNLRYLLEPIGLIHDDHLVLNFKADLSALLLVACDADKGYQWRYLVMAMML